MEKISPKLHQISNNYIPGFSIEGVVLSFHKGTLRILLNKSEIFNKWLLPGGLVYKDESVEDAAWRLLKSHTRMEEAFIKQFYLFGDMERANTALKEDMLKNSNIHLNHIRCILDRYISLAFYVLIDYSKVELNTSPEEGHFEWFDIDDLPPLMADHNAIIEKAIETLRIFLGYIPIGYGLLPEKFTMPELRIIYEIILGKKLDRRNFQRKMLSTDLFIKLNETKKTGAHKSPILYQFNEEKYKHALKYGLQLMDWKKL